MRGLLMTKLVGRALVGRALVGRALVVSALVVSTLLVATPSEARACSYEPRYDAAGRVIPPPEPIQWWEIGMIPQAVTNLVFVGLDVGYAAAGQTIPPELAVLEMVVGAINLTFAHLWGFGVFSLWGGCHASHRWEEMPVGAGVSLGFAIYFLVHGITGFKNREQTPPTFSPTFVVTPSGFTVGIAGLLD